jgi:hypothetical protein
MIPPASYGLPHLAARSPTAWLSSEITPEDGAGTNSKLEHVRILIVLQWETALDRTEGQFLGSISEQLASRERFPNLKSVEAILCLWSGQAEGCVRTVKPMRPYVGSKKVLKAYKKDMEALSQRGAPLFDLRWEYCDVRPWGMC